MEHKYNRDFSGDDQPQPNQALADRHDRKESGRHRADHISISRHVFSAGAGASGLSAVFV
jgi:hypothetical protein